MMTDPIRAAGRVVRPPGPLGGARGEWAYRSLRFHLPIAVASGALLVLFMTLPPFDPQAYPQSDMGSAGAFPERRGEGAPMGRGGDQAAPMGHGGDEAGPTATPTGHGRAQAGPTATPTAHDGARTPAPGHGGDPTSAPGHGGDQVGPIDPDGTGQNRGRSNTTQRSTVATGYVATGLLAITLLVGPANVLFRKRNPVSSYLRRDVGMWTAAFSVVHVIYGSLLHSGGQISAFLAYFVAPDGGPRLNSFGLGNWTGLAATVIVLGLLTISSDLALRTLKAGPWKWLQRMNYALFALVIAHALFYGALLRTDSPYTLLLLVSVIAVLVGQAVGVWLYRRTYPRRAESA